LVSVVKDVCTWVTVDASAVAVVVETSVMVDTSGVIVMAFALCVWVEVMVDGGSVIVTRAAAWVSVKVIVDAGCDIDIDIVIGGAVIVTDLVVTDVTAGRVIVFGTTIFVELWTTVDVTVEGCSVFVSVTDVVLVEGGNVVV
jgi:hypothetical protein